MNIRTIIILSFYLIMNSSCSISSFNTNNLFILKDAVYQSWTHEGKENGTDIIITLEKTNKDIIFRSVIFRGIETDVIVSHNKGKTYLKGTINTGLSTFGEKRYKINRSNNAFTYEYNNELFSYPLTSIQRKETEFIR